MNAAREQFSRNPFAALLNQSNDSNINRQVGTENTEPLPNPWAPRSTTSTTSTSSTSTTTTTTSTSSGNTQPAQTNPFAGGMGGAGLWNTPGMQSYMQQITQNPRLMESIVNTPYMQSITQTLASNPDLTRQIMENNPMLQSNPEMRETLMRSMPTLLQQLQNPEMQQLLTNPDALQAVLQIQEGMQRLQTVAPGLLNGFVKSFFDNIWLLKYFILQIGFSKSSSIRYTNITTTTINDHNNYNTIIVNFKTKSNTISKSKSKYIELFLSNAQYDV